MNKPLLRGMMFMSSLFDQADVDDPHLQVEEDYCEKDTNTLRCVVISDTHGKHRKLAVPNGDVLIHCGDMTTFGELDVLESFVDWFGKMPHRVKIVIAGNHDVSLDPQFRSEKYGNYTEEEVRQARALLTGSPDRFHFLENSSVLVDGIKFYGSPITPTFHHWAFMAERGTEIAQHWQNIPDDTDVLITHGPPHGILDTNFKRHSGCEQLLHEIQTRIKPKFHLFGHIHGSHGTTQNGPTHFVNACSVNMLNRITHQPIIIHVSKVEH